MDLEEQTLENPGDHCEVCGATLTSAELKTVMESGGPALCAIHMAEAEPGLEVEESATGGPEAE